MASCTKKVGIIYGAWVTVFLTIATYGLVFTEHGEYGISAHLWLLLTGMPLSFVSLLFSDASFLSIAIAGVAGIIQWCVIAEFLCGSNKRKIEHKK